MQVKEWYEKQKKRHKMGDVIRYCTRRHQD